MFSNDSQPIRPPRSQRRVRDDRNDTNDEMETFCGQFPNRMKRNFSSDVLTSNSREAIAFQDLQQSLPSQSKRASNLEISRTLSQNGSPFVPLFGPNIHPLMGQMWRPLRHSQTQVIVPVRPTKCESRVEQRVEQRVEHKLEPKREKPSVETFEEHFNQYKCQMRELREDEDLTQRKSVFKTLERKKRALSSEKPLKSERKASLPLDYASDTKVFQMEPKSKVEVKEQRRTGLREWMGERVLVLLVVAVNCVLGSLFVILMIY